MRGLCGLKRAIAVVVLSAISYTSFAQTLWRENSYGMSLDEVKKANPAAIVPAKPAGLGTGAIGLLELPGVELAGIPFTARFFFIDGKLQQVTLELGGGYTSAEVGLIHNQLDAALTKKYGEHARRPWGNMLNTISWQPGHIGVTLFSMELEGKAQLRVSYHPPKS
ncbi:hypothetical protein [Burkholderia sp. LMU1-1-1.1]|uniref:hypothetical protein n=1 Tax=Burkholderia sp. LMU1-1-1.1 TaxID=3135266 RepID=UPI00343B72E3